MHKFALRCGYILYSLCVALTPVSMAIFSSLAAKGKEPSAPCKIAYGMVVAAVGFAIMLVGSKGLNTPNDQQRAIALVIVYKKSRTA